MLAVVGASSVEELLAATVPASILLDHEVALPGARSVEDVLGELRALASKNRARTSLIGMGYSGTIVPPVDEPIQGSPSLSHAFPPENGHGRVRLGLTAPPRVQRSMS